MECALEVEVEDKLDRILTDDCPVGSVISHRSCAYRWTVCSDAAAARLERTIAAAIESDG